MTDIQSADVPLLDADKHAPASESVAAADAAPSDDVVALQKRLTSFLATHGALSWLQCPKASSRVCLVSGAVSLLTSIIIFSVCAETAQSSHNNTTAAGDPAPPQQCTAPFGPSTFRPTRSAFDCAVIDAVRTLVVYRFLSTFRPKHALYFVSVALCVMLGKLFALDWSAANTYHGDKAVVIVTVGVTCLQALGCASTAIFSTSSLEGVTLRSLWKLTRPYIWPSTAIGRGWSAVAWLLLLLSQACKLLAPLQLAHIIVLLGGQLEDGAGEADKAKKTITTTTLMPPSAPFTTTTTTTTALVFNSTSGAPEPLVKCTESEVVVQILWFAMLSMFPRYFSELRDLAFCNVWELSFRELNDMCFSYVLSLKLEFHQEPDHAPGRVAKVIAEGVNSVDELAYAVMMHLLPALGFSIAAFVIFVAHLEQPLIAAICFTLFSSYIVITVFLIREKQTERDALGEASSALHGRGVDILSGVADIKASGAERRAGRWMKDDIEHLCETYMLTRRAHSVVDVAQVTISGTARFAALAIAGAATVVYARGSEEEAAAGAAARDSNWIRAVTTPVTVASFVAIKELLEKAFEPLDELAKTMIEIVRALLDLKELAVLLERSDVREPPEPSDAVDLRSLPPPIKTLCKHVRYVERDADTGDLHTRDVEICVRAPQGLSIEFRNVSFTYPARKDEKKEGTAPSRGLRDISFFVPAGHTLGIVSSSGGFKSTIAKLLLRMYDNYTGEILVGGVDIRRSKHLRRVVGFVPQDVSLFNVPILDNVTLALDEEALEATDPAQVRAVFEKTRLLGMLEHLPNACQTIAAQGTVSGGEKQRIALARALLHNPRILIADEHTASLDAVTEAEIDREVQRWAATHGTTSVIVAHRLHQVCGADLIICLHDGRVAEQGTHAELLQIEHGLYSTLWNTQLASSFRGFSSEAAAAVAAASSAAAAAAAAATSAAAAAVE